MRRVRPVRDRPASPDGVTCSMRALFAICAAFIVVCLIGYIPIMLKEKHVPRFDWGPEVNRNTSHYIRPDDNTTLLQPAGHSAGGCRPFLLVVVSSAVKNFPARNAIRQTWGAPANLPADVVIRFLVGTTANGSLVENLIAESEVHDDLVQQDFVDVYSNLTLKTVMMLKWVTSSCQPNYILKADEDMYVNIPRLHAYLKAEGRPDLITGALICNAEPRLDKYSKYFSPRYMFAARRFPAYVSGTAYVLGSDVAARLYRTALTTPLYHLEDVFLTGICASKLGVRPTDHVGFTFWRRAMEPCEFNAVMMAHELTPDELRAMWRRLQEPGLEAACAAASPPYKPRKLVKCRR
ncbi:beta-1,3-galactosyltransferase 1-like isoform X2 [Pollicipes pollicipes]|nr:beta-1,3-galactosyltransferase 1-like isoform X2 [Pollicipes pollicipes]XP_037076629.1 beta-1,3-galactosyltransferase 1-like isoform X2 [Pollicipes pollicipes]